MSEIYYPIGWTAKIDGNETKIYQVNHVLRGIHVPSGNHKITFVFAPKSYFTSLKLLWAGDILILGLIIVPGVFSFRKKQTNHIPDKS